MVAGMVPSPPPSTPSASVEGAARPMEPAAERDSATKGYAAFQSARHFPQLDGLRAVSIVGVIWYHCSHEALHGILGKGGNGVTLFFAISGFLITTLLLRERAAKGDISLRRFYIRRALRIFPLYYATLALYCVSEALLERDPDVARAFWHHVPSFATYTSNWFVTLPPHARVVFVFAWSLATEEQFYLFWPATVRASRGRLAVGVMLALMGVVAVSQLVFPPLYAAPTYARILMSPSGAICMGAVAAYVVHSERGFALVWPVVGHRWACVLALAATLGALAIDPTPDWALFAALTWLVVTCSVRPDGVLAPVFNGAALRYVGTISYGMYLLHMFCENVARRVLPGQPWFVVFALTLVFTLVAATISYRYFEKPFLRWKERFSSEARA
jgi:peptidoglycan/LPS O-acetylase OafA/YrhL